MAQKVVIVGAGSVGATFAYALMQSGQAQEIVLLDVNPERAKGEAMDLQQGVAFTRPVEVRSGTYDDCRDAEAVVVTAGAKQNPGESRLQLAGRNAAILKEMVPKIMEKGFAGILIMVSNPVDVLTQLAWKLSGLPRSRVIGSGTVLDSARLRSLLSSHCGVDARNIHALVIGEHGDSELAAWSAANIGGVPMRTYCNQCGSCPSEEQYPKLLDEVKRSAYEIIARKGATFYAVGLALVQIIDAILRDEKRVFPVSTVLEDFHGIRDVALALPAILGRQGVERILDMDLSGPEMAALQESARVIKKSLDSILENG